MRPWLARLAVPAAVIAAGVFTLSPAAWAVTTATININPGNVSTTAVGFKNHDCDPNFGGGPLAGQDVWVFVLPQNTGDFESLTATFGAHGDVTITRALNPGNFTTPGASTSKAWITTPAGWTLTAASADVTGSTDSFNLTHTCPAGSTTTTTPPTSETTSTTSTGSSTTSTATTPGGGTSSTGGGGNLPTTGVALTGFVLAGLALIGGGIGALMFARRRRDANPTEI